MTNGTLRRAGVSALAALLALFGLVLPLAGTAGAAQGFNCTRLAGNDRYETAAAIALATFPQGTETVLLATGEKFPDALAGNFLAGNRNAPILLTTQAALPTVTRQAIQTLKARNVIILGREEAVSTAVENDLKDDTSAAAGGGTLNVTRIGGVDRYETAAQIATAPNTTVGTVDGKRTAILARGNAFPDALAAGPGAFAAKLPILLTPGADEGTAGTTLHPSAKAALQSLQIENIIVTGGEQAVSASTETDAKNARSPQTTITSTRLGGADRTETARLITEFFIQKLGFSTTKINIARGDDFPDALTGGPHAGTEKAGILLTVGINTLSAESSGLGTGARRFLQEHSNTLTGCHIFGGEQAVSAAVETEIEQLGTGGGATVTVTSNNVQPGGNVTGTITGENIQSVTVSGCGLNNQAVTDTDNNTAGRQFSVAIPSSQPAGQCTLTFTTTFTNGSTETDAVTINVGQVGQSATTRPELVSAAIGTTTTAAQAAAGGGPAGTTVRYTFDENVLASGAAGPVAGQFLVYERDGDSLEATEIVSSTGNTVTVRFAAIDTAEEVAVLTVATVEFGAVTDTNGQQNPEGDAAIGTAGGGSTNQPAGITTAPDLVSVTGFRQGAAFDLDNDGTIEATEQGTTAVDFTFDEPAFVVDRAGFSLILTDGTEVDCFAQTVGTPAAGAGSNPSGGNTPGGNGTTTITVLCQNPDAQDEGTVAGGQFDPTITAAQVARGTVDAGTVSDAQQVDDDAGTAGFQNTAVEGNDNPLQAAPVSNGGNTTTRPDLVSVEFRPGATAADNDQALFTFDQPVVAETSATVAQRPDATDFNIYKTDGTEIPGVTATVNPNNRNQVLVTFGSTTATDNAVGGNVEDNAVFAANADGTPVNAVTGLGNQQDEEGTANTSTDAGQTPGRTDGPDLTAVTIARGPNDAFGNPGAFQVTYTFDEDVDEASITDNLFFLYLADGTRLTATACDERTITATQSEEDFDNTVVCTAYDNPAGLTAAQQDARVGSAVLGTVESGAVNDEEAGGDVNPEGAEFTTGGTGTRTT